MTAREMIDCIAGMTDAERLEFSKLVTPIVLNQPIETFDFPISGTVDSVVSWHKIVAEMTPEQRKQQEFSTICPSRHDAPAPQ